MEPATEHLELAASESPVLRSQIVTSRPDGCRNPPDTIRRAAPPARDESTLPPTAGPVAGGLASSSLRSPRDWETTVFADQTTAPRPHRDPRELPCYGIGEAARYLGLPQATLRSWVDGRTYTAGGERRRSVPLIDLPDPTDRSLSFLNLVEAHVLKAIRGRGVSMPKIRQALDWLEQYSRRPHPLASHQFATDGVRLFVEHLDDVVDLSPGTRGQAIIPEVLERYLERIEHDEAGVAARLYPFTRRVEEQSPRLVVIDARLAFGRPVIRGTSIPTQIVVERYKAGETMSELSADYGRPLEEIEEAIRCEIAHAEAA